MYILRRATRQSKVSYLKMFEKETFSNDVVNKFSHSSRFFGRGRESSGNETFTNVVISEDEESSTSPNDAFQSEPKFEDSGAGLELSEAERQAMRERVKQRSKLGTLASDPVTPPDFSQFADAPEEYEKPVEPIAQPVAPLPSQSTPSLETSSVIPEKSAEKSQLLSFIQSNPLRAGVGRGKPRPEEERKVQSLEKHRVERQVTENQPPNAVGFKGKDRYLWMAASGGSPGQIQKNSPRTPKSAMKSLEISPIKGSSNTPNSELTDALNREVLWTTMVGETQGEGNWGKSPGRGAGIKEMGKKSPPLGQRADEKRGEAGEKEDFMSLLQEVGDKRPIPGFSRWIGREPSKAPQVGAGRGGGAVKGRERPEARDRRMGRVRETEQRQEEGPLGQQRALGLGFSGLGGQVPVEDGEKRGEKVGRRVAGIRTGQRDRFREEERSRSDGVPGDKGKKKSFVRRGRSKRRGETEGDWEMGGEEEMGDVGELQVSGEEMNRWMIEEERRKEALATHEDLMIILEPEYELVVDRNPDLKEREVRRVPDLFLDYFERNSDRIEAMDKILDDKFKGKKGSSLNGAASDIQVLMRRYRGPQRITAREANERLERELEKMPLHLSGEAKGFLERSLTTLKSNPSLTLKQKQQLLGTFVKTLSST